MSQTTECPTCGRDDFKSRKGMQWHHAKQHGEPYRITVRCSNCGSELDRPPHRVDRSENQFCDRDCNDAYLHGREAPESHNFRREGKSQYECDHCGKSFERYPSRVVGEKTFCSFECKNDALRGSRKHGIHYGSNWKEQRKKRLEKDGYECVICQKGNEQEKIDNGQSLHVHHIRKARNYRIKGNQIDYEKANRIENLITLCVKCHHWWEDIPLKPDIDR